MNALLTYKLIGVPWVYKQAIQNLVNQFNKYNKDRYKLSISASEI